MARSIIPNLKYGLFISAGPSQCTQAGFPLNLPSFARGTPGHSTGAVEIDDLMNASFNLADCRPRVLVHLPATDSAEEQHPCGEGLLQTGVHNLAVRWLSGTSTCSHDASLYSGRSAPAISPAQNRQSESNDWTRLGPPAAAHSDVIKPTRIARVADFTINSFKEIMVSLWLRQ
jgi:hypothetical protein